MPGGDYPMSSYNLTVSGSVMMNMAISQLMDWRAGLLRDGRVEDLARQHLFPLAVYSGGAARPVASASQLADLFQTMHQNIRLLGDARLNAKVRAVELPRNGRFRVWTEWLLESPGKPDQMVARTVDFMRDTPKGPMTEMLECDCPQTALVSTAAAV